MASDGELGELYASISADKTEFDGAVKEINAELDDLRKPVVVPVTTDGAQQMAGALQEANAHGTSLSSTLTTVSVVSRAAGGNMSRMAIAALRLNRNLAGTSATLDRMLPVLMRASGILTSAMVGWQIGSWLRDNTGLGKAMEGMWTNLFFSGSTYLTPEDEDIILRGKLARGVRIKRIEDEAFSAGEDPYAPGGKLGRALTRAEEYQKRLKKMREDQRKAEEDEAARKRIDDDKRALADLKREHDRMIDPKGVRAQELREAKSLIPLLEAKLEIEKATTKYQDKMREIERDILRNKMAVLRIEKELADEREKGEQEYQSNLERREDLIGNIEEGRRRRNLTPVSVTGDMLAAMRLSQSTLSKDQESLDVEKKQLEELKRLNTAISRHQMETGVFY